MPVGRRQFVVLAANIIGRINYIDEEDRPLVPIILVGIAIAKCPDEAALPYCFLISLSASYGDIADLPAVMQAGRWRSPTMPARYAERLLAGRGAVARLQERRGG